MKSVWTAMILLGLLLSPAHAKAVDKVLKCTVKSVDADKGKLVVSLGERISRTLQVATDARIETRDRRQVELSTIRPGSLVLLNVDKDRRVVHKLKLVSSPPDPEAAEAKIPGPPTNTDDEIRANFQYAISIHPAKRVLAQLSTYLTVNGLRDPSWVIVAPLPPQLPGQPQIEVQFEPSGSVIDDLANKSRKLVQITVEGRPDVLVQARYVAVLSARKLVPRASVDAVNPPKLSAEERDSYLIADGQSDWKEAAFQEWMKSNGPTRQVGESQVDFGRRTFLALKRHYRYIYHSTMDRRASVVCRAGATDCGGFASLFVSILRSNGIPARALVGRWAISSKPGETLGDIKYGQQHVKCEFFADGVGWVPVDLSSAILHDKSPAGLEYFGQDKGDFIAMHVDYEIEFDSLGSGIKSATWIQDVNYWARGKGKPSFSKSDAWIVNSQ